MQVHEDMLVSLQHSGAVAGGFYFGLLACGVRADQSMHLKFTTGHGTRDDNRVQIVKYLFLKE